MTRDLLVVTEDDPSMRLVALALGADIDEPMRGALARLFLPQPDDTLRRLRAMARHAGLEDALDTVVAQDRSTLTELAAAQYVLVEAAPLTAGALERASHLRLIVKHGEDTRNIDLAAAAARGIPVVTIRRRANSSVAEQAMLLLLALRKHLVASRDRAIEHGDPRIERASPNWSRMSGIAQVRGSILGIVGLGEVGREVARRAKAFEMRVLYTQRRRLEAGLEAELGAEYRPLDALLAESDAVTLHVPLVAETEKLIGPRQLGLMRPHAILVNTARAALVDEVALLAALREERLGGAGLDVWSGRSPAEARTLAAMGNVLLTPYTAYGGGDTLLEDVRAVLDVIARGRGAS